MTIIIIVICYLNEVLIIYFEFNGAMLAGILIKFMETNQTQINFQNVFTNLLAQLTEREQEVLKHRFQLKSDLDKRLTLKRIGDNYNITRERVRQIERDAIAKLVEESDKEPFVSDLRTIEDNCLCFIERHGGLVREDQLLENYIEENYEFDALHANAFLFVMDHLFDSVEKVYDHEYFYDSWRLADMELEEIVKLIDKLSASFEARKKLHDEAEMLRLAEELLHSELRGRLEIFLNKHNDLDLTSLLAQYIEATSKIEKNISDKWGLAHWETVRPKKLSDKIKLIFSKVEKPLHFREIAEKIQEAKFDHKNICAATIHNELIASDNFVLIGRGLYAPVGWGYAAGTVADIIRSVLKGAGRPMTKDEILDEVLKQRQVNKSTVYLTLINRDKFSRTPEGKFNLL